MQKQSGADGIGGEEEVSMEEVVRRLLGTGLEEDEIAWRGVVEELAGMEVEADGERGKRKGEDSG